MIGHIETACFHYSGGCEMIFASNREAEWIRTTPDIRECYGKLFDKESGSSVVMLSPAKKWYHIDNKQNDTQSVRR